MELLNKLNEEYKELQRKIVALEEYIFNENFPADDTSADLLYLQLEIMLKYARILKTRMYFAAE